MRNVPPYKLAQWFLLIIYSVGMVGLSLKDYQSDFNNLTPLNLWMSSMLLLLFSKNTSINYFIWVAFVSLSGFFVEMLGVKTGFPFGNYWYGDALGYKINDIPVTIGLNWLVLIMGTVGIAQRTTLSPIFKSALAATLMVAIDFLIEPVAIKLDFWSWEGGHIPLSNYLAWWGISFGLVYSFYAMKLKTTNKIAPYLFVLQVIFFLVLNFTL